MRKKPSYVQLQKGSLLLASPDIDTGIYFRGVVLLCEHGESGSFGLLINKPLNIEIPESLSPIKHISNKRVQTCTGGPLQSTQIMLLHSEALKIKETLKICEGVYLGGTLQFMQEAIADVEGPSMHICFGFCGWEAGQLEQEYLMGLWLVQPASSEAVFEIASEHLWHSILRQMGGQYVALSMVPDDPSFN